MGLKYKHVPFEICLQLKRKYKLRYFIESGTLSGRSSIFASSYFDLVYTIDICEDYIHKAKELARRGGARMDKLRFLAGDSRVILPIVLKRIDSPAFIWLDAHWSPDLQYEQPECLCPLLEEIDTLNLDGRSHVILIDDARLFLWPPAIYKDRWPSYNEIYKKLHGLPRKVTIDSDIIFALPNGG